MRIRAWTPVVTVPLSEPQSERRRLDPMTRAPVIDFVPQGIGQRGRRDAPVTSDQGRDQAFERTDERDVVIWRENRCDPAAHTLDQGG